MGERLEVGDVQFWVERYGQGPGVLLIAGLSDPAEGWQLQLEGLADRYHLIAFDNRGTGRTSLPEEPLSVTTMADDAGALLRALEILTLSSDPSSSPGAGCRRWRRVSVPSSRRSSRGCTRRARTRTVQWTSS